MFSRQPDSSQSLGWWPLQVDVDLAVEEGLLEGPRPVHPARELVGACTQPAPPITTTTQWAYS